MSTKNLSTVTNELITCYGNTARNVIQAYRVGNARMTSYVDQRWASAVDKAGAQLTSDVRKNALAAQQKVSAYYSKGISLTTDSADLAVNKAVELAGKGLTQVAANANRFEKATGVTALNTLAAVAVPAAVAVSGVALKLEAKSDQLVKTLAGAKPKAKARVAQRKAAVAKPVAAKPVVAKRKVASKPAAVAAVAAAQAE